MRETCDARPEHLRLIKNATIIKYIGDAVLAAWGVPVAESRHAERAVLAAWGMSQASKQEIAGRHQHES